MLQPDGTAYFYGVTQQNFGCSHSFLYVVWTWNERTPAFCGLCFLTNLFRDEHPTRIHEYKKLADNGNPDMKSAFVSHLQHALGMKSPLPGQSLKNFRLAREQYARKPSKQHQPATFALWTLFGYQPKMAHLLLRMMLGSTENDLLTEGFSIYQTQTTVAKAIRTALRYVR